ncbi:MAG: DNA polymerase III subunit gamma/tau [Candidatus Omnitrophica bacterium]|nr:DNA polymerase III subunit gamma/tau [Candidatus Omnitrophota bacterium]
MSYQVLAQKYRPVNFEDVVGQESVTRTIINSIEKNRISNAYIFSGPRGVGKTSVARLIAKVLNCQNPTPKGPCNICKQCTQVNKASSMDVLEIDGASNRGIDEIRALRENVKFMPVSGKYKVYIIDEVHMLTTEAFNALLKTLEEPPEHVKFIFATTEPHKVLATIMSRCQRFDFRRISPVQISERLLDIAKNENIAIEPSAINVIAKAADGSLRDAVVILDQMISFSNEKVLTKDVTDLLGMLSSDTVIGIAEALIDKDPQGVLRLVDELIDSGKEPVYIAKNIIDYFRDLMIIKITGSPSGDMILTQEERTKINKLSEKITIEDILYILQNLLHSISLMRGTVSARVPLELVLVKLVKRDSILSIKETLAKLDNKMPEATVNRVQQQPPKSPAKPEFIEKEDEPQPEHSNIDEIPKGKDEQSLWSTILANVKSQKMSVYTFLSHAKPLEINEKNVILGFAKGQEFHKDVLNTGENKDFLEKIIAEFVGPNVKLELKVFDFMGNSDKDKKEAQKKIEKMREATNPVIEKAMDIFGGQIVKDMMEGD